MSSSNSSKKPGPGPVVMRKRRTGMRLLSTGELVRLSYRAGVKRQSAAVRAAMRLVAEPLIRDLMRKLNDLVRSSSRKVISEEDVRFVCRKQGRPLLTGYHPRSSSARKSKVAKG